MTHPTMKCYALSICRLSVAGPADISDVVFRIVDQTRYTEVDTRYQNREFWNRTAYSTARCTSRTSYRKDFALSSGHVPNSELLSMVRFPVSHHHRALFCKQLSLNLTDYWKTYFSADQAGHIACYSLTRR